VNEGIAVGIVDERVTRELRRTVLRPQLPPDAPLPGDGIIGGLHFAATTGDGTVVCTCFIYLDAWPLQPEREPAWHLRQMATAEAFRNRGIGGVVLEATAQYVANNGGQLVWCNARERAVPFYARHGFVGHGRLFTDDRHPVPHLRMLRELSGHPTTSAR
jgi:predicted GNAT family N-acyltransferase